MATARFIRRLDKIAAALKPGGLQHFVNLSMLGESVLAMVRTGKNVSREALEGISGAKPDTLSWATDEEQSQLTGGEWILHEMQVTGVRFNDWFHRSSNDVGLGLVAPLPLT